MKRKARVHYTEMDGREGYAVEIYIDGEWGLDTFFPIIDNFIHFGIINKLSYLKDLGYDIRFSYTR